MDSNLSKPVFQIYENTRKKCAKKSIPVCNMHFDFSHCNFPVFTYKRANTLFKRELYNIQKLLNYIDNLNLQLTAADTSIQQNGQYLNMFINNSLHLHTQFNYLKHFLIFESNSIEIHELIELDEAAVDTEINNIYWEEQSELFAYLPHHTKYQLNSTTLPICEQLYNAYMQSVADYDDLEERIISATELHDMLAAKLKTALSYLPSKNISTNDPPQTFNAEIHQMLMLHTAKELKIFYILYEHEDEFSNIIAKQLAS